MYVTSKRHPISIIYTFALHIIAMFVPCCRLHTVIDSDLIMVLSDGQLVELGSPLQLSENVRIFVMLTQ
jgi:ABC-type multidrug transport system fused ATPase/permease subunit